MPALRLAPLVLALVVGTTLLQSTTHAQEEDWAHAAWLDDRFLVRWTPGPEDITFELTVATLGYVGFGISHDGRMWGSDLVIGWLQHGRVHFQDRHVPRGHIEPVVDASQDWELLAGAENDTHTVLRFRRPYDTCDSGQDLRITNDTLRLIYAYHNEDPVPGLPLAYHGPGQRGTRSAFLVMRVDQRAPLVRGDEPLHTWELRNPSVLLPSSEETLYWCKIFKLPSSLSKKHHVVRYAPLHQPGNRPYMHHALVYECSGDAKELEKLSREQGSACYQPNSPFALQGCSNVALAWASGSEGFTFPPEAGYPLDPTSNTRFYMLETHYTNPSLHAGVRDSSGLRIWHTPKLRANDAGVLSIGMDPNWRHIIPPGQPAVISEGHCIGACTKNALPEEGVSVFAVMLHTHLIGRRVRLRHIRGSEELAPVAADNNYDASYQEFRRLSKPAKVMPGDHLITECVYDSEGRSAITLGGLTIREEMCLAYTLYWPRADLSLCYSLPSLPTVLHSLGIQELWPGSSPVRIKAPTDLADMTLEHRLLSYDWERNFAHFQETTHAGSFKPLCWHSAKPTLLPGTEDAETFFPNITRPYTDPGSGTCAGGRPRRKQQPRRPADPPQRTTVTDTIVGNSIDEQEAGLVSETSRLNIGPSLRAFSWIAAAAVCLVPMLLA